MTSPEPKQVFIQEHEIIGMTVTSYCPCVLCCDSWSDGFYADGTPVGGLVVAADTDYYPMGTKIFKGFIITPPFKMFFYLETGFQIMARIFVIFFTNIITNEAQ